MFHQFKDVKKFSTPKKYSKNAKSNEYRLLKLQLKFIVNKIEVKEKSDGVKKAYFKMELYDGQNICNCLAFDSNIEACLKKFKEGQNYSTDADAFKYKKRETKYPSNLKVWFDLYINNLNGIRQLNNDDIGNTSIQSPPEASLMSLKQFKDEINSRKRRKNSFYKIGNVSLTCNVHRYIGCSKCKRKVNTKVTRKSGLIYSCPKRRCPEKAVPRTQFFRLSNIVLSDGKEEFEGLIAFHNVAQDIIRIPPSEYMSDLEYERIIHLNKTRKYAARIKVSYDRRFGKTLVIEELISTDPFLEIAEDGSEHTSESDECSENYDITEVIPDANSPPTRFNYSDLSSDDETNSTLKTDCPHKPLTIIVRKTCSSYQRKQPSYEFTRNFKGAALIINNVNVKGERKRIGSVVDKENIITLFEQLKFDIYALEDVPSTRLNEVLDDFKSNCLDNEAEAICIVLMSHGQYDSIQMQDGVLLNIWKHLIYKFGDEECPDLFEIPKMFFIESCNHGGTSIEKDHKYQDIANTIVFQSSLPGSVSVLRKCCGTPFIQTICKIFARHSINTDLRQMLEMVEQKIKKLKTKKKQIPRITAINFSNFYFPLRN